jgi:hypothetical protein
MRRLQVFAILLCVLALVGASVWATGSGEAKKALPPGPAFDSAASPKDEGMVKPIATKSPKPIKIAVLGLENNPFWIPVKEGTLGSRGACAPELQGRLDQCRCAAHHRRVQQGHGSGNGRRLRRHRHGRR